MLHINDEEIEKVLGYNKLIVALQEMFCTDYTMPVRHHHFYQTKDGVENTLILMPVWNDRYLGLKQVTVAPNNHKQHLPAIFAQYILSNSQTGQPLAQMNAEQITSRRTACTSALAARYLARKDARTLLIVGGGKVAEHLVQAHCQVLKYENILVWIRNAEKRADFVARMKARGYAVKEATDLEQAAREADVISTATLSPVPIIKGEWIKAGTHLDLIGAHKPSTREVDDDAIRKSKVFVDSRAGALHETGELAIPIANGILKPDDVCADIVELCRGKHAGRTSDEEITLFKSAGLAVEDFAAALLVYHEFADKAAN